MNYATTMENTELRKAISYLLYKKMKRIFTSDDEKEMKMFKNELDERSKSHGEQ